MDPTSDVQEIAAKSMGKATRVLDAWGRGVQALTVEMADTSRKALGAGAAFWQDVVAADSLDRVAAVQTDYARHVYETAIGHATRVNTLLVDMTRDAIKPFETLKL